MPILYPKEMVGCFIVQVLDKVEEKAMKDGSIAETSFESHIIADAYNSPCIWDSESEEYDNKERLIEKIWFIAVVKEKKIECNESCEECPAFDEEDCSIMESIAKMIEGCCLFEADVFLDDKGPQKQEIKGNVKKDVRHLVNDPIDDSLI